MKTMPEKELEEYTLLNEKLKFVNNTLDIIKKVADLKEKNQISKEEIETLETIKKVAMLKIWGLDISKKDKLVSETEDKINMQQFEEDIIKRFGY